MSDTASDYTKVKSTNFVTSSDAFVYSVWGGLVCSKVSYIVGTLLLWNFQTELCQILALSVTKFNDNAMFQINYKFKIITNV